VRRYIEWLRGPVDVEADAPDPDPVG
jgi:hypothetical protein